jgi:hypothetical protein
MKTPSAKKKAAKTLEEILASIDTDMAAVVAAIDAERRLKPPSRRPHRHRRHEPAKAA